MSTLLINDNPLIILPSLAIKIGLKEAVVLQQIHFWINGKKKKNDIKYYKEGKFWTYNSYSQWQDQFRFWSEKSIQRAITKLEDLNLVISGNFNYKTFDRTKWYTVDYKVLKEIELEIEKELDLALEKELAKVGRASGHADQMALDKLTSSNIDTETSLAENTSSKRNYKEKISSEPIKKPKEPKLTFEEFSSTEFPDYIDTELMHEYFKHRKSKMTKFALKLLLGNLSKAHSDGIDVNEALKSSIISGWDGVFPKGNQPKSNGTYINKDFDKEEDYLEGCEGFVGADK